MYFTEPEWCLEIIIFSVISDDTKTKKIAVISGKILGLLFFFWNPDFSEWQVT